MEHAFAKVAVTEEHPRYKSLIARKNRLYDRQNDFRSPFARDYTRILHSTAYRRLKHKTQVFFCTENDHVCTRMEHVAHVESVSSTIADSLGLNTELTRAIAFGHDLGHAPFGHEGERILDDISRKYLGESFWHERNGVYITDHLQLLENERGVKHHLGLTYAVRDGIISHCGEVDENGLRPREALIDLDDFRSAGQYAPATWEGCVVKLSDKIAYLGRDIEDAQSLGLLNAAERRELSELASHFGFFAINTSALMHNLIQDVCRHSDPAVGICLGEEYCKLLDAVKAYNYAHIYTHPRQQPFRRYAQLVLNELFDALAACYDGNHTFATLEEHAAAGDSPELMRGFAHWLAPYCTDRLPAGEARRYQNEKCYGNLETKHIYLRAVRDYVAGMTDQYTRRMYEERLRVGSIS